MKQKNIRMAEFVSLVSVNQFVLLMLPFVSGMVYDFFQEGMIFSFYGDFLFKEEREGLNMPKWKKPIGGCLKCFHVWVCILFLLIVGDFKFINLPLISVSYFILTISYYR